MGGIGTQIANNLQADLGYKTIIAVIDGCTCSVHDQNDWLG